MHKNKYILIATLLITMFINVSTIDAKEIEYTCTYKTLVDSFAPTDFQVPEEMTLEVYKEKDVNKNATRVYSKFVANWLKDRQYTIKINDKTYLNKTVPAWYTEEKYEAGECPAYLKYFFYVPSTTSIDEAVVFNSKEEFTAFQDAYVQAKKELSKDNLKNPTGLFYYGIYTDPISSEKNNHQEVIANTEFENDSFDKSNYTDVCEYTLGNENTISLLLYRNSQESVIKDINEPKDLTFKDRLEHPFEVLSNKPNTYKQDYQTKIRIVNSVGNPSTCPVYIYRFIGAITEENGNHIQEVVEYYTGTGKRDSSITASTYGVEKTDTFKLDTAADPETGTARELSESELPNIGIDVDITSGNTCELIIGEQLQKTIDKILKYVRILVPILIIVLGLTDFGRAILSSKEEEMKKAQATFIKRLIIGVAIFLLPTLINLIIDLANMAWKNGLFGNSSCGIK